MRQVRLFAAIAALTLFGVSSAAAGWGCCAPPPPVNWGCGNAGCVPVSLFYTSTNCCGSPWWGCGSSCGSVWSGCGSSCGLGGFYGGYASSPVYVVPQQPLYEPPLSGYTYPVFPCSLAGCDPFVCSYVYRHPCRPPVYWGPPGYPFYGARAHHHHRMPVHYAPRRDTSEPPDLPIK
jgi:hypothetical protein